MSSYLFQMKFFPAAPVTPAWSNASSPVSAGAETSGHVVTKLDAGNPSSATLSQQCMFKWKRKACWLASTTSGAPARDNLAETTFKRPAKQQHRDLAEVSRNELHLFNRTWTKTLAFPCVFPYKSRERNPFQNTRTLDNGNTNLEAEGDYILRASTKPHLITLL